MHRYHSFSTGLMALLLGGCLNPQTQQSVETAQPVAAETAASQEASVLQFAPGAPSATQGFLQDLDRLYRQDPALLAGHVRSNALAVQSTSRANPLRPDISLVGNTLGVDPLRLQLNQPIYDFGKRNAEVAQLDAQRGVELHDLDDVRQALLSSALEAIETTRFAKKRIALHRRQIADYGEARVAAKRLVDLNLASATELRLAEVEQKRAEIDLNLAKRDLADSNLVWTRLFPNENVPTGVELGALRRVSGIAKLDSALRVAAVSNLSVRDLLAQRNLLLADRVLEDRSFRPTVGAEVGVDLLDLRDEPVSVGLTLNVPLVNRRHQEALTQLDAQVSANMAETTAQRRDIGISLQRAQQRAVSARGLAKKQRSTEGLLVQRVKDVDLQVSNGLAKYTDVIEARVEVFEAELSALTSDHEARLAEIEIILLTGILVPDNVN